MKKFLGTAAFCILLIIMAQQYAWHSGHEFHSILETAATLIALFTGSLALIRYYARRDLEILMLAAAYFGAAALNTFHVLGTSVLFGHWLGGDWESLIPWSWTAERIFLGLYLMAAGDTLWSLRNPELYKRGMERRAVIAAVIMVIACFAYFVSAPNASVYTGGTLGRPTEAFPMLFFALAFLSFWRLRDWRNGGINYWLMQSIIIAFMAQICMLFAGQNFDPFFDVAHILKILSLAVMLYGLSQDVSTLYDSEVETLGRLTQHESLLAEAQEIAHFGNWEWHLDSGEIHWSDELYRVFGVSPDSFEVSFESYMALIHADDRKQVSDSVQRCAKDGQDYQMLHRALHPDGTVRWLQCRGRAIRNTEGKVVRLVGTAQDITENRLSEERFRNLMEAAPDGMVICDANGTITLVNAQAEKLFGYEREEMLGSALETLIPERYRPQHHGHRQAYFKAPVVRSMGTGVDLYGRRKNGQEFPVEVSLSPFMTAQGRFVIAAVRDVTESRKAQQKLALYAQELEHSNVELERFAYVASHDMKEPLRKIQAFGDRLVDRYADQLGDTGKDYIRRMQDAASRMSSLIEDMLTYSRIDKRSGAWERVDLQELLDTSLHNLDLLIHENHARITADQLPTVEGHPWQLEMLFHNLLGNALKYRSPKRAPEIHIQVQADSPEPGWVEIRFQDNGIGFDDNYGAQIFEPFERLHTHKEYPGTGIGLSICRKVVDRHQGHISASGVPDQGACFVLQLPLTQSGQKA